MVTVTFQKDWDRFQAGKSWTIERTLAARLIQSGIAKVFEPENADPPQVETATIPDIPDAAIKKTRPYRKTVSKKR